jgi:hypothetical protein
MAKEVEEFCAFCKTTVKMPIVQEDGQEPGFLWVQCPNCHEIKPLETRPGEGFIEESGPLGREPDRAAGRKPLRPPRADEPAPGSGDHPSVRTYQPGEEYEPGDLIYHEQWKDTGKVVSKKESGGGRRIMVVEFEKMGQRKLVMEAERGK